ncbi:MAG: phosphohistidine phosphatase SixA [Pseudohongiellaceae bacterium]|jgi:phosphohistidine phosphatase SixA
MLKSLIFIFSLALPALALAQDVTTIYLVRHAEKVDTSRDSDLTEVGKQRAQDFAKLLQDRTLTHVYSTPFVRTKNTAAPTALRHNLDIEEYDSGKTEDFTSMLKILTGTALVVGHSNTIPKLVNLLTGENFDDLDEQVYDKVYIVKFVDSVYSSLEIIHTQPRTPNR